ncbi:hypothetical protein DERF_002692 [Dermatophagoides farinae]|uniref:Uncharacterized protein n=1 Tax=Dermatophagoides farinae TaxID=6954 RepID=A0A922IDE1_DERFA|nr:hypothetical protein DERF_002692 [Dermatophagoides farinae]
MFLLSGADQMVSGKCLPDGSMVRITVGINRITGHRGWWPYDYVVKALFNTAFKHVGVIFSIHTFADEMLTSTVQADSVDFSADNTQQCA